MTETGAEAESVPETVTVKVSGSVTGKEAVTEAGSVSIASRLSPPAVAVAVKVSGTVTGTGAVIEVRRTSVTDVRQDMGNTLARG